MSPYVAEILAAFASSTPRLEMTSLCGDAQAPIRESRGRVAKYASDSASEVRSTRPSIRTTLSSSTQWNCSAACGCASSSRALRLR